MSLDGAETYVLSGGHFIVNGVLTVNADFQSGQFGIQLDDLSDLPTNTGPPTGPFLWCLPAPMDATSMAGQGFLALVKPSLVWEAMTIFTGFYRG